MMRMMRTATIAPTADSGKPTFEIKAYFQKLHDFFLTDLACRSLLRSGFVKSFCLLKKVKLCEVDTIG